MLLWLLIRETNCGSEDRWKTFNDDRVLLWHVTADINIIQHLAEWSNMEPKYGTDSNNACVCVQRDDRASKFYGLFRKPFCEYFLCATGEVWRCRKFREQSVQWGALFGVCICEYVYLNPILPSDKHTPISSHLYGSRMVLLDGDNGDLTGAAGARAPGGGGY